jgi:hypothetical protein
VEKYLVETSRFDIFLKISTIQLIKWSRDIKQSCRKLLVCTIYDVRFMFNGLFGRKEAKFHFPIYNIFQNGMSIFLLMVLGRRVELL